MPQQQSPGGTTTVLTNTFSKGMVRDVNASVLGEGIWTSARNAMNVSHLGDAYVLGNEPSNLQCGKAPFDIISVEHIKGDSYLVFSAGNKTSEIGIFTETGCRYMKVVRHACLNFSTEYPITAVIQENHDCTTSVYFADGNNPDRVLNLDRVPYKITGYSGDDCKVPQYSDQLDCDQIRLMSLVEAPKMHLSKGVGSGLLPNGYYQAAIAYTVKGLRVTDYFTPSNGQSLWSHENNGGALELNLDFVDTRFAEYELVIIAMIGNQATARRIGFYSTTQTKVYLDNYPETLPAVQLSLIPLSKPVYEKSDKMFSLNGYLLRSGISAPLEPNYQPQALKIRTKWVEVEYPADYYVKGGHNTSYMRDENGIFFIRWIYQSAHRTASYPIVGRAPQGSDTAIASNTGDILDGRNLNWQVNNTASRTAVNPYRINWQGEADPEGLGGLVTGEGLMGYHETSEHFPAQRPDIWEDVCGKNIRLHKFPDHNISHTNTADGSKIRVLGVRFENITHPLDEKGNPIPGIIGYEILRGSQDGNKTVIAKGLLQNFREFPDAEGGPVNKKQGLYQNYPANDLRPDNFMSRTKKGWDFFTGYRKDMFSFHSPDTNFKRPYLAAHELKVHGEIFGKAEGAFDYPFKHPKHKLINDMMLDMCLVVGGVMAFMDSKGATVSHPGLTFTDDTAQVGALQAATTANGIITTLGGGPIMAAITGLQSVTGVSSNSFAGAAGWGAGWSVQKSTKTSNNGPARAVTGSIPAMPEIVREGMEDAYALASMLFYGSKNVNATLGVARAFMQRQQYALQYNMHGFFGDYSAAVANQTRRPIEKAAYQDGYISDFDNKYFVNNLFRNKMVAVRTAGTIADPRSLDDSRQRVYDQGIYDNPTKGFETRVSGHLVSLKARLDNQFGQLDSVVQIPIHSGVQRTEPVKGKPFNSPVLFGGDVYINRYTEKTSFFYFHTWLMGEPDETEINYLDYVNIPYPAYWANLEVFDVADMNIKLNLSITNPINITRPSDFFKLDGTKKGSSVIKERYFYLFNSGVRDFFVESEVNLAQRDYGERDELKHYDQNGGFTDLSTMFRSDIIKKPVYYAYDYSLSWSKFINNYVTWGKMLPRDFDPKVYSTCFTYYPNHVAYSLQQMAEMKKDAWRIFLANNIATFKNKISSIKPMNKTGAMILFEDAEPAMFNGVDQLQTDSGMKLTVGDGGLFNQPFQSIVNADDVLEYGSCQAMRSVANTPHGMFWISQRNGKIHQAGGEGGVGEISSNGLKQWFAKYLPCQLTTLFPDYPHTDNPIHGVGCQVVYDNQYELLYFCKRDFTVKKGKNVTWDPGKGQFTAGGLTIRQGDEVYFEECSWTVSYDPKSKAWISYHDWFPNLVVPSSDHFFTIQKDTFWKHNKATDSYCRFYGKQQPFEVEVPVNSPGTVTTIRSLEFYLECYEYSGDGNAFHVLDQCFDYAMLYNSEQVSGWMKLTVQPKNDPKGLLGYPLVTAKGSEILVSKEENKYRFNQFWDATKDRGEFSGSRFPVIHTALNGVTRTVYQPAIDWLKSPLQRKRFRHYEHRVVFRKTEPMKEKMLLKAVRTQVALSAR